MPVDEDEWELGKDENTVEMQILEFLRENDDTAYTKYEIGELLFGISQPDKSDGWGKQMLSAAMTGFRTNQIEEALEELVEAGYVEKKRIQNGTEHDIEAGVRLEDDVYYRAM